MMRSGWGSSRRHDKTKKEFCTVELEVATCPDEWVNLLNAQNGRTEEKMDELTDD